MAGPKVVIDIEGDADGALAATEQTRSKIKELTATVEAMGRTMNASSKTAVAAWRSEAAEAQQALTMLRATKDEHARLQRVVQGVETNISAAGQKFASATRQMAFGFESVARSGNLAGEGMKSLIATGSEMALMFGTAGPIVGAVGVAGLAIYNIFDRLDKRAAESAKRIRDEFEKMLGTTSRVSIAESLNQHAKDLIAAASLLEDLKATAAETPAFRVDAKIGSVANEERLRLDRQIEATQDRIRSIKTDIALLNERDLVLARSEGEERVRNLSLANQLKTAEEGIAAAARRQLDFARENAQIREKLNKELFGTDAIGRASEGVAPARLPDTLKAGGSVSGPGAIAFPSPDLSGVEGLALGIEGITSELIKIPSVAQTAFGSIKGAADAAFDALVMGGGDAIKSLKKAFGEPIVAHLKSEFALNMVLAASSAAQLNFPKAAGHLKAAGMAMAGAAVVARLTGVSGGGGAGSGGGGGGGSASVNQRSDGSGLGASLGAGQRELRVQFEPLIIVVKDQDGRQISRIQQKLQRLRDLEQPIRTVL
jgi:hypothetical protein